MKWSTYVPCYHIATDGRCWAVKLDRTVLACFDTIELARTYCEWRKSWTHNGYYPWFTYAPNTWRRTA